jgi:hypothetical protein
MPISSFSAKQLASLILRISENTMGLDALRCDVVPLACDIISQTDDDSKKVLAYVLWKKCLSICDHFDGEPMTEEESQTIVTHLRGVIMETLQFLGGNVENDKIAIRLAVAIMSIDVT